MCTIPCCYMVLIIIFVRNFLRFHCVDLPQLSLLYLWGWTAMLFFILTFMKNPGTNIFEYKVSSPFKAFP